MKKERKTDTTSNVTERERRSCKNKKKKEGSFEREKV